jgi:NADH-quinone oxidoreductase subunit G
MSDQIKIKINGNEIEATKGQMIIEVTDNNQVHVPRFCYHPKLSIAANCRMCMVEVKNVGKPLPACATPISDGMEIFTKTPLALTAQKGTMEFLLLNHPLDCPICDQGGECELQDMAIGHGQGKTRYELSKRVVKDKDIGTLVSTDMTRCIHCTRCVRFGDEILGQQNLGTLGRGESTRIDTFLENSLDHELSGNVIDICPVGALNSKPFRFSARSWEMTSKPSISTHDGIGTNTYVHVLRNEIKRVVPRVNETINGNWIADRDRFSYVALSSEDRVKQPHVSEPSAGKPSNWDDAIKLFTDEIISAVATSGPEAIGVIVSPNISIEEMYLIKQITEHLNIKNIDYRIKDSDFTNDHTSLNEPQFISSLKTKDMFLVVGSHLRDEVPILASQLNQYVSCGAKISIIGGSQKYLFDAEHYLSGDAFFEDVLSISSALRKIKADARGIDFPVTEYSQSHEATARSLIDAKDGVILVGQLAINSSKASILKILLGYIAKETDVDLVFLPYGANSYGAETIGLLPNKRIGNITSDDAGLNLKSMLQSPRKIYVLYGLEPQDIAMNELAMQAFSTADSVYLFSSFLPGEAVPNIKSILPIATHMESPGTYINLFGQWQTIKQAIIPADQIKEGWRVLRYIGSSIGMKQFSYQTAEEVCDELKIYKTIQHAGVAHEKTQSTQVQSNYSNDIFYESIYQRDAMLRRSDCLQKTKLDLYL